MLGATSRVGTAYPSGARLVYNGVLVARSLVTSIYVDCFESTGKYVTSSNLLLIKTPLSIKRLEEHWDYFHILEG
jgi:hypothetical protein